MHHTHEISRRALLSFPFYLFIYLFTYLFIYLSIYLFIYLCIYLFYLFVMDIFIEDE